MRQSRQEKQIRAALRAQFRLKQQLERIDHEEDIVEPAIAHYLSKATLPAPPEAIVVDILDDSLKEVLDAARAVADSTKTPAGA